MVRFELLPLPATDAIVYTALFHLIFRLILFLTKCNRIQLVCGWLDCIWGSQSVFIGGSNRGYQAERAITVWGIAAASMLINIDLFESIKGPFSHEKADSNTFHRPDKWSPSDSVRVVSEGPRHHPARSSCTNRCLSSFWRHLFCGVVILTAVDWDKDLTMAVGSRIFRSNIIRSLWQITIPNLNSSSKRLVVGYPIVNSGDRHLTATSTHHARTCPKMVFWKCQKMVFWKCPKMVFLSQWLVCKVEVGWRQLIGVKNSGGVRHQLCRKPIWCCQEEKYELINH